MTRISFGILLVLLGVVVEGYSNDGMEYFLPVLIALSMRLKLFFTVQLSNADKPVAFDSAAHAT
jgi:hypothetical protein